VIPAAAGDELLPDDVLFQIDEIGSTDILIGIPCFNNEETIGNVIRAVESGLRKHFPDLKALICISDGGSQDRTLNVARSAEVGEDWQTLLVPPDGPVPKRIAFPYRGLPGKGSAFRSIFEVAVRLGAKACAVVDSDLRSITPYWLDRLLTPVVHHDYGYVTPIYARHKYDGTITNCIAYPITTALYGQRIRQPIGGEFGVSGDLAKTYAAQDVWGSDVARFGIDIWMTTVALTEGAKMGQAILGAKIHDAKDPGKDLAPMFRQVVGSLFALAGIYRDHWWDVDSATTPPTFGFPAEYTAEPIKVSVPRLTWKFVEGYVRHQTLWRQILSVEALAGVQGAVGDAAENTRGLVLDVDLWTKIVYDYLIAYNARKMDTGTLIDSMIPLYFARTASFITEVRDADPHEAERRIATNADAAITIKPYLKRRWRDQGVPDHDLRSQLVPVEGEQPEGMAGALEQHNR
jgi:glycosyltransferase involved in cell wall biosynthesis